MLDKPAFSQTAKSEHVPQLRRQMQNILHLLGRCGVETAGATIREHPVRRAASSYPASEDGIPRIEVRLGLPDGLSFAGRVGFRYCMDKSLRTSAASVYWRTIARINEQRLWMADRVVEQRRAHPRVSFAVARASAATSDARARAGRLSALLAARGPRSLRSAAEPIGARVQAAAPGFLRFPIADRNVPPDGGEGLVRATRGPRRGRYQQALLRREGIADRTNVLATGRGPSSRGPARGVRLVGRGRARLRGRDRRGPQLHRKLRPAARADRARCDRRESRRGRGPVGKSQLRRPRESSHARELSRLAAARGGVRARRNGGHRSREGSARHGEGRQAGILERRVAIAEGDRRHHRERAQARTVRAGIRERVRRQSALERDPGGRGHAVPVGATSPRTSTSRHSSVDSR